jgi:hypothetical protein
MKTKVMSLIVLIVFVLCLLGQPVKSVQSANPTLSPNPCLLKDCHTIKFYLPTAYQSQYSIPILRSYLIGYVADMNAVISKNTNRWLVFQPFPGIIFTDTDPHTNTAPLPLPDYGFEIWAVIKQSNSGFSYGGYGGLDISGAGVLGGMHWQQLYNPSNITIETGLEDYWRQINNMLHEFAHVFKAGIGEYYKLCTINDTTGTPPLQNINCLNGTNDPYWSDKPDFFADPLLRNAMQAGYDTKAELLGYAQYANLTAWIMNHPYRNGHPEVDFDNVVVTVTCGGVPRQHDVVKVWSVVGNSPYASTLIVNTLTNAQGQVTFDWGGSNIHNNYNFLRLIKAYPGAMTCGTVPGKAKYFSVFDADIESMNGETTLNIVVELQ